MKSFITYLLIVAKPQLKTKKDNNVHTLEDTDLKALYVYLFLFILFYLCLLVDFSFRLS